MVFEFAFDYPQFSLHFLQILSFTKYRMAGVYLLVPIPRRGDFRWLIKWLSSWTSKVPQKIYWFVGIEHHVQKKAYMLKHLLIIMANDDL